MRENLPNKLFIKDNRGRLEYIITIERTKRHAHTIYSLFASDDPMWCEGARNKLLFMLTDTGNGIKIKKPKKGLTSLQYDEALYLQILLNLDNSHCSAPSQITVVDENGDNPIKIV